MSEEVAQPVVEETQQNNGPDNGPGKQDSRRSGNPRFGGKKRRQRPAREPKEFEESIIQIDRVTRVTKGGRQLRFRVSVVIGDKKGRVGFGIGKSGEVMVGVQKAIATAKKNLVRVPIFEDSIPHLSSAKFKATKVTLFPAPEGKGVIAGSSVRKILELSGVKNVLSKLHGSRNRINAAYATMDALNALESKAPYKPKSAGNADDTAAATVDAAEKKAPVKKKPAAKKAAPKKSEKSES